MESLIKILIESLEKFLVPLLKVLWRFSICRIKKLAFPVKDLRMRIKQSRMRYYRVQFSYRSGEKFDAYQEVDSNGNVRGYYRDDGKRYIPEVVHECSHLDDGKFQFPQWARMDWRDIFSGDVNSGCWAITEK